jgi:hypothetical protein
MNLRIEFLSKPANLCGVRRPQRDAKGGVLPLQS